MPEIRLARAGEQTTSLVSIAIANAGIVRGGQAAAVVVSWALATRERGHELGSTGDGSLSAAVREYADYWSMSERTAWRELARFRAGFPGEDTPARLAALLLDLVDEQGQRAVAAPVLVVAA